MKTSIFQTEQNQPSISFTIVLLICIFIMSLILRIAYIKSTVIIKPINRDAKQYIIYGYNIINYGVYSSNTFSTKKAPAPDSFRSPGYPLVVALSLALAGKEWKYFLLYLQAITGSLLPILTFLTALFFLPYGWAIIASILIAFNPHLISFTSYFLTETLFGFTALSSILFFQYSIKYNFTYLFVIAAIFCGYSYLINETFFFIPYFCTLIIYYKLNNKNINIKKVRHNLLIFIIIFSIFPAGWIVRNKISLTANTSKNSSRAIATMSHGSYPDFIYKSNRYKYFPYREDPKQPEFGSSFTVFTKVLFERIKQRPLKYFIWYCFKKPYYLWSWNILQGQGDIYVYPVTKSLYTLSPVLNITKEIMHWFHPLILFLSFISTPLYYLKNKDNINNKKYNFTFVIILLFFIYYTILYTFFASWPRYSVPLRPILYLSGLWSAYKLLNIRKFL